MKVTLKIFRKKFNELTTHQRNSQVLMTEVFKMINGYAPPILANFFIFRENTHNFRNFQIILNENKKVVRYGSDTTSYRTHLPWTNLQEEHYADLSFRI